MRIIMTVSMLCLAGCAAQAPSAGAPPAPVAAAAPAATAGAAQITPVASADPNATQYDDVIKKALKGGYYVAKRNGVNTYCRDQAKVGTRFIDKVCYTPEQLTQVFALQQVEQDQMRQGGGCGGCGGTK